jgi:serine protease Do
MKLLKFGGVLVTLFGAVALALVVTPFVFGPFDSRALAQGRPFDSAQGRQELRDLEWSARSLMTLAGRGAEIGVRIAEGTSTGVVIDEIQPDSPAEKAGLKRSDVILEFDGERVRSARQFGRLVAETPPGRTVKATIMRDGQRQDVQIRPSEGRGARVWMDTDVLRGMRGDLGRLRDRLPAFDFNFDFDLPGALSGRRLGARVGELTDQLAQYFGAKKGVLVTSVTDGSAALRAGLKAGDVITSINGEPVRSQDDLIRGLRDANGDELTIGIVRDKKESKLVVSR